LRYELRPKKHLTISKVAVYEMSTRNKARTSEAEETVDDLHMTCTTRKIEEFLSSLFNAVVSY